MPNSLVLFRVGETNIHAELQIPIAELQLAVHYSLSDSNELILKKYDSNLRKYILDHLDILTPNGDYWSKRIDSIQIATLTAQNQPEYIEQLQYRELIIALTLTPPDDQTLRAFDLNYDVVVRELVTHKIFVNVEQDWRNGIHEETQQQVGIIKTDIKTNTVFPLHVNLEDGSIWKGFGGMFTFGMRHIREGLDHILFLLTLLLVAPLIIQQRKWSNFQGLRYTLLRFMKISLAFTIGHSTTLLIGSFINARVNTQAIEILIAFSILVSAIHCIKPLFYSKETLIASIFGLVHGLAFSFSIAGMQLNWKLKLISILGFNIGIEVMQLIIMVCFFPILLLSKWNFYRWLRIAFAILTILASLGWIAERVSGQENIVTGYLNTFFS